jgi:hypothetical protein
MSLQVQSVDAITSLREAHSESIRELREAEEAIAGRDEENAELRARNAELEDEVRPMLRYAVPCHAMPCDAMP